MVLMTLRGWCRMKLVNILDVVKIANGSVDKFSGIKRYIATGDLSENIISSYSEVTYDNRPSRANVQVKFGQVIFARMKDTKKVLLIDDDNVDFIYSTGFCVFEPSKSILSDYLRVILNSDLFQNQKDKYSKGATQKAINNEGLKKIQIPLPPLETQKKIVEVLDKAQGLIDARKEQIKLMDDLIQSVFYEMFGDPVTNPKGWEVKELRLLCDIYRGGSPRPIKDFLGGTVPWIKIGDATGGDDVYLDSTREHIIEEGVKKSRLVKKGSLIFANCGVSLGFARIINFDGCIHDGWLSFENIDKSVNKIFLLKLLNCYTDYFRNSAPDGTQPNLNTAIMKKFNVIVPPIEIQEKYMERLKNMANQKDNLMESLSSMEDAYKSIMYNSFT